MKDVLAHVHQLDGTQHHGGAHFVLGVADGHAIQQLALEGHGGLCHPRRLDDDSGHGREPRLVQLVHLRPKVPGAMVGSLQIPLTHHMNNELPGAQHVLQRVTAALAFVHTGEQKHARVMRHNCTASHEETKRKKKHKKILSNLPKNTRERRRDDGKTCRKTAPNCRRPLRRYWTPVRWAAARRRR
eukprot:scaffold1006_cov270-Pinguiococcus_pyrenoidosus.AAC.18